MKQAATLWSQLSSQMLEVVSESLSPRKDVEQLEYNSLADVETQQQQANFSHWQQQILDESLFSRHELIRTLYRHPKQD